MIREGDEVLATRPMGLLGSVPRGAAGVVTRCGLFGECEVAFFGGPTVRGIPESDLEQIPAGPWWAQPSPSSESEPVDATPAEMPSGRRLGLRLLLAVPFLALLGWVAWSVWPM